MTSSTKHFYLSIRILYQTIRLFLFIAETRQKGRLAGFSLNVSISSDGVQKSTQCYKDRLELPPLNFTTKCEEFGRYVIFYNERLDGVAYPTGYELQTVFTELCEVIVQGKYEKNVDAVTSLTTRTKVLPSSLHLLAPIFGS